jgi:hypothetical protein
MSTALDHSQDLSGAELHRLTNIYPPPEFVKAASHAQLHGDDNTPPTTYADPIGNMYRMHTPAAVWLSTLFYNDKKASFSPSRQVVIEKNLADAAAHFGIAGEVAKLKEAMSRDEGNDLARLPDSQFAIVWTSEGGEKQRHYPLRNRVEVKTASEWFGQHRDQFAYPDRQQIAHKILERADEYGAQVDDREMLTKTAGHGACSNDQAVGMLEKRATLTVRQHPAEAEQLREMAATLKGNPLSAIDFETRYKIATVIDQYDRATHLDRLYNDGLERPEEALFTVTEKVASDFLAEHISTVTGRVYEKAALGKLTLDRIREWMGDEVADAVGIGGHVDMHKLADIVTTLPRNDADMFDRMAESVGLAPRSLEKVAETRGPSPQEIAELATKYRESVRHPTPA